MNRETCEKVERGIGELITLSKEQSLELSEEEKAFARITLKAVEECL